MRLHFPKQPCSSLVQRSRPTGPRSVLFDERERSPQVPAQRLPQPAPRPRLPVQDTCCRPEGVKAVLVGWQSGRGTLALALTPLVA